MHIHRNPREDRSRALLAACGLPEADLEAAHFQHFFGCGPESEPRGIVGVELLGPVALLRSLAVHESARGRGCGARLVREAERHAAANRVRELYLLTESADGFFLALGYEPVERAAVPEPIRGTGEFTHLCPSGARVMRKDLAARAGAAPPA